MTNDDPLFNRNWFGQLLQAENEWDADFALSQAGYIFAHAGWAMDSSHTEVELLMAAVSYWDAHPIPPELEGPAFC